MRIVLAPMEGVIDHIMRDLLTRIGGIDLCVTEFVRVSDQLLPPRVFHRDCPELLSGCQTPAGVPVVLQLLGGKAAPMAENAAMAAELGAPAIDINFGCPAKTVNRHDGGASLLRSPERIYEIVSAVRRAVPATIPVTAKIRLGFSDTSLALDNALAVESAGAREITVHGRTRQDGYKPPAYWDWIGRIREALAIPVIANGEIWTVEDYHRCREESGCQDVMIGRGLIRYPDLALRIKADGAGAVQPAAINLFDLLLEFFLLSQKQNKPARYLCDRTKQWASLLGIGHPDVMAFFQDIKREKCQESILKRILAYQSASPPSATPRLSVPA
ncbi:MAG: tRNA-dihydrouridine synthase family protein [Ketobacteraceae bacterium]|nr:tRNA-dihydrouridine synthase family protein [Ketobacteraceae bacterium]